MGNLRIRNFLDQPRRRVSQRELNGIANRNAQYRAGKNGGQRAVLSFCDLRDLDFSGMDLSGADLTGAELSGGTFVRTRFTDATLFISELRATKLRDCDLSGSDMRGACLRGSDLSYVRMQNADLREAVVAHYNDTGDIEVRTRDTVTAELVRTRLNGADLRRARLPASLCIQSDMEDADLRGAVLKGAVMRASNLRGVDFDGADLSQADFFQADLQGAILTNVNINGSNFEGCNIAEAVMDEASLNVLLPLANTPVYDAERFERLRPLLAQHGDWVESQGGGGRKLVLTGAILRDIDLSDQDLSGARFQNCRFETVRLDRTKCVVSQFIDCKFFNCEMTETDLRGASLASSRFKNCRLDRVTFAALWKANGALNGGGPVNGNSNVGNDTGTAAVPGEPKRRGRMIPGTLRGASFHDCSLVDTVMSDVTGQQIQFRNTSLKAVSVEGANLEGSRFIGCKLDKVDLDRASHKGIEFFW